MPVEPLELAEARAHLIKFEAAIGGLEGVAHLSEALALLADIRVSGSEEFGKTAINLAATHAKRVQREIEPLISQETPIHLEIYDHWRKVFAEFDQAGFSLPEEVANARSKLWDKFTSRLIRQMSPSERKDLLEQLRAMDDEQGI